MIEKLKFLKIGARKGPVSAEEERLMQLFQNRAGLKKTYADLQDEFHLLRDRLKQQEGATIRAKEQFDALGDLLADPRSGYSALAFYQLRALWKTCHQKLEVFAADLAHQQETRETAKFLEECTAERNLRLQGAEERLRAAAAAADEARLRLSGAERDVGRLSSYWHFFRRRRMQKSLQPLRDAVTVAESPVRDMRAECETIKNEEAAPFPGISLMARRNINLAIIGYAELLCDYVDAFGVAARAKEAVARRVHEMNFGSREQCEDYMRRVQQAVATVTNQKQINSAVKLKLDRLRATCQYRNAADTVPTADSLVAAPAALAAIGKGGKPGPEVNWNVLAEDYWDLYTLLLR